MTLLLLLIACSTTPTCEEVEQAASEHVRAVVADHQTCTFPEDCAVVAVAGSCFDSCSDVVSADAVADVEAAVTEAEALYCVDYDGCTLIVPPCAPPGAPDCVEGLCTG